MEAKGEVPLGGNTLGHKLSLWKKVLKKKEKEIGIEEGL